MWIPADFRGTDAQAYEIIRANPFALLVLVDPATQQPVLTHLPMVHLPDAGGPYGMLEGHVAKANPASKLLLQGGSGTIVFTGPHAYISAGWYQDARTVPTWNYVAVHAHGSIVPVIEATEVAASLARLTAQYEPHGGNWTANTHTDPGFTDKLQKGITAFQVQIEQLECQVKLSQNRSQADHVRIVSQLEASGHPDDAATAEWMRRTGVRM